MSKCDLCGRERTPEDTLDYSFLQVVHGQPFGWYSEDDAEICSECMTKTIRSQ